MGQDGNSGRAPEIRRLAMSSQTHGTGRERPQIAGRVSVDNAILAFAALFQALTLEKADRAEQRIVGTPFRMIAYRLRGSDDAEALHFEIHPKTPVA